MLSKEQEISLFGKELGRAYHVDELLRRPDVTYKMLTDLPEIGIGSVDDSAVAEQVEIQFKYAGYIDRQMAEIEKHKRHEETALPLNLAYGLVSGLSNEAKQKLEETKPASIGQASRISGVTPAAISLLLVHLKKQELQKKNKNKVL